MKKIIPIIGAIFLFACSNSKTDPATGNTEKTASTIDEKKAATSADAPAPGSATFTYSVEGVEKTIEGAILVQQDKSKLSAGNDYFGIITANGSNKESFNLNFLFSLKPGTYPIVGMGYSRDASNGSGEVYGGLMGGTPKLTNYKVTLTECENMGSNNMGGHKWKISGFVEGEVIIDALGIMKMDKEHPDNITARQIKFANLSFDDNWDEMLEKGMKMLKEE